MGTVFNGISPLQVLDWVLQDFPVPWRNYRGSLEGLF